MKTKVQGQVGGRTLAARALLGGQATSSPKHLYPLCRTKSLPCEVGARSEAQQVDGNGEGDARLTRRDLTQSESERSEAGLGKAS